MSTTKSAPPGPVRPVRFMVVGSGWRSECFLRVARALPGRIDVTGVVTRSAERAAEVERTWAVPAFRDLEPAVAEGSPEFVLVAVPWAASPGVIGAVVALGIPVLAETPPAPDLPGLVALWSQVGESGLVQVAEQYPRYPGHAARIELIRHGVLGTVSNVQVSSTHGYHAVALMRAMLGADFADATVSGFVTTADLVDPMARDGWTGDLSAKPTRTVVAHLDLGSGRSALYDFTDNQWHNELRSNRILVRGSRGEVVTDHVVHAADATTIVESDLVRRQLGKDMNFEGFDLDHISFEGEVLYRNAWHGGRLADDELAIADLLRDTAAWARSEGPAPYPLAAACQDHMIALAIDESIRDGLPVRTQTQRWAAGRRGDGRGACTVDGISSRRSEGNF